MLIETCALMKLNGVLLKGVIWMKLELAEAHKKQRKGGTVKQPTKDAVAANKDAQKEVLVRMKKSKKLRCSHGQTLLARNAVVERLKVQLVRPQKRVDGSEYKRDGQIQNVSVVIAKRSALVPGGVVPCVRRDCGMDY